MGWIPGTGLGKLNQGRKFPILHSGVRADNYGFGFREVGNDQRSFLDNQKGSPLGVTFNGQNVYTEDLKLDSLNTNFAELHIATLFEDFFEDEGLVGIHTKAEIFVRIFDFRVRCLIDTGSEITCISVELLEKLIGKSKQGITALPIKPIQIRGAFGQRSLKIQQIVALPLLFGEIEIPTELLVVPRLVRPIILGLDWLGTKQAILNLGNFEKKLSITNESGQVIELPLAVNEEVALECNNISGITKSLQPSFLDQVNVGEQITATQIRSLHEVLKNHSGLFTKILGRANCYVHEIRMEPHIPKINRTYPVPYAYRNKIGAKINEMISMKIISRASTPYCSPLTYAIKPDGSVRVLLDAREINKYMISESEAPPMQIDVLNSFHGVKYITVIDLNNAYFQIPISEKSRQYTGFTFNGKSYVYNVLPQGLKTSVGSFSRAMDTILGAEVKDFCVNYLDDLAILTSGTWSEHLDHINVVLGKLNKAGLTCNIAKCKFGCKEVKMLGHIVSTDGIKTDPAKLGTIQNFPQPQKIKQLRGFLGLCNYYRKFIPRYSELIEPLTNLLRKDQKWNWGQDVDKAFKEIKRNFISTVELSHPDPNSTYYLQTDSSGVGIAGSLYQYDLEGNVKLLAFCSKGLRGPELRWTVTEQEFFAVIYSLKKFETYLRGARLVIRTDHKPLVFVKQMKLFNARIARWIQFLEQFDYKVEHVRGVDNQGVDILSRYPGGSSVQENKTRPLEIAYMGVKLNEGLSKKLKELKRYQRSDELTGKLISRLSGRGELDGRLERIASRCIVRDQMLYFKGGIRGMEREVIFLPEDLLGDIIEQVHLEMGHSGTWKTLTYIRDRFYRPGLIKAVKLIVKRCHICQLAKCDNVKYVGPYNPVVVQNPGDLVMADLYGPILTGRSGNNYIFVVQDVFSKFTKLYSLVTATSEAVLSKIQDYCQVLKPKVVLTDNGTQFTAREWKEGLRELGVKTIYTTIRNPRTNAVERVNRELGKYLRLFCQEDHRLWDLKIREIETLYNNTIHDSIKFSPMEVISGESPKLTIDKFIQGGHTLDVEEIRRLTRENLVKSATGRKRRFDHTKKVTEFQIGENVKVRKYNKPGEHPNRYKKFELLYEGPYVVASRPYPNVYVLTKPDSGEVRGVFNTVNLAHYY